jgi:hypothetical protein
MADLQSEPTVSDVEVKPEATPEVTNVQEIEPSVSWGDDAPKGGKTVIGRMLKDGAKVPLFLGQTLVNSLRDMGYNSTTSALCEHVDNAIQWGATEIRVYFHQIGKRGESKISTLVYDNGKGMAPNVLKVATAFGGSLVYENRNGIGRYGIGMKAAALSISPAFEVYSWQELRAFYQMILDVKELGNSRSNLIELEDPSLNEQLPSEIVEILTRHMAYPKNPHESQTLLADNWDDLLLRLGPSGTIVYMADCDRLTYRKASTLVDHATKEMGRIYRRYISKGLRLYVNNRLVEAFDPTYWMQSARHTQIEGLNPTQSKLVRSWRINVPVGEGSLETTEISVRLFALPFEEWGALSRKVKNNDLHVFDDHTVSFMRNEREVEIGSSYPRLKIRKHGDLNWLRLEVDFTGEADEGFGVAANKQGIRLKEYVAERIVEQISQEVTNAREDIKRIQAKRAAAKSNISDAERRATDAEGHQAKPLPELPEDERVALDQNLRALSVTLKRENETDEQAFLRIKASQYVTVFKHDEYWPFYHCDFKYGKVILTINTAHPFFSSIWQPLSQMAKTMMAEGELGSDDTVDVSAGTSQTCSNVLSAIQSMLLSLARTQSQLCHGDSEGEYAKLFDQLRREWSGNLATQLLTN